MSVLTWLIVGAHASEWNPNEGMLADQVLQADGQGERANGGALPLHYAGH